MRRMSAILLMLALALPSVHGEEARRCEEDGKVLITNLPCPGTRLAEAPALAAPTQAPENASSPLRWLEQSLRSDHESLSIWLEWAKVTLPLLVLLALARLAFARKRRRRGD